MNKYNLGDIVRWKSGGLERKIKKVCKRKTGHYEYWLVDYHRPVSEVELELVKPQNK